MKATKKNLIVTLKQKYTGQLYSFCLKPINEDQEFIVIENIHGMEVYRMLADEGDLSHTYRFALTHYQIIGIQLLED